MPPFPHIGQIFWGPSTNILAVPSLSKWPFHEALDQDSENPSSTHSVIVTSLERDHQVRLLWISCSLCMRHRCYYFTPSKGCCEQTHLICETCLREVNGSCIYATQKRFPRCCITFSITNKLWPTNEIPQGALPQLLEPVQGQGCWQVPASPYPMCSLKPDP